MGLERMFLRKLKKAALGIAVFCSLKPGRHVHPVDHPKSPNLDDKVSASRKNPAGPDKQNKIAARLADVNSKSTGEFAQRCICCDVAQTVMSQNYQTNDAGTREKIALERH